MYEHYRSNIISDEEMEIFKLYAKDIKTELKEALTVAGQVKNRSSLDQLKKVIKDIVISYQERSNIFVRYSLNRSIALCEILEQEDNSKETLSIGLQARILTQSLKNASFYADFDFKRYEEFELQTYAYFGADYFSLLNELSKSITDASAQYKIMIASLEFLQWDLYRELEHSKNAPVITRIHHFLSKEPKKISSDFEYISQIRIVKKFISLLPIKPYLGSVTAHEMEAIINDAVSKNKNFDNSSAYKKGEEILVVTGNYSDVNVSERLFYKQPFFSTQEHELNPKDSKKVTIASDFEMFRPQGCLLKESLCVGEPVNTINGPFTIVAISKNSGRALAVNRNQEYYAGYPGGFYKFAGCDTTVNVCVGDKLIMQKGWPATYEVKTVTGISSRPNGYGLFYFGDSLYDDKTTIGNAGMFAGKM